MYSRFKDSWQKLLSMNFDYCKINFEVLTALYCATNRYYHNFKHIQMCLDELNEYKKSIDMVRQNLLRNLDYIEFALWYHDAIYGHEDFDNENASAILAQQVLMFSSNEAYSCYYVPRLIRATKHVVLSSFDPDDSQAASMIVDIDLAIFGKCPEVFQEYEVNIRKEYSKYNNEVFNKSRIKILRDFLDRPHIYYTEFFRQKYEIQARINLQEAIKKLEK